MLANLGWPQLVYVMLTLIGIGVGIASHGKPRANHNIFTDILASLLIYFLLIKGGFFG